MSTENAVFCEDSPHTTTMLHPQRLRNLASASTTLDLEFFFSGGCWLATVSFNQRKRLGGYGVVMRHLCARFFVDECNHLEAANLPQRISGRSWIALTIDFR